jgi:hypothetical protein
MISKKHAVGTTTACLATVALSLGAGVAQANPGGAPPTFCVTPFSPQLAGLQTAQQNGAPIILTFFCKAPI